jgi:glutamine synthetase adenylyltransferase
MCGWSLEFTVDVDNARRLVRSKIFGIWRGTHVDDYHREFEEKAQELFDKPWAKLVDLTGWKTSYPDTIQRVADHMHWCHERNNVLSVYVVNNPSTFRQLREMIARGGIVREAVVFRTLAEAEHYLAEHWRPQK